MWSPGWTYGLEWDHNRNPENEDFFREKVCVAQIVLEFMAVFFLPWPPGCWYYRMHQAWPDQYMCPYMYALPSLPSYQNPTHPLYLLLKSKADLNHLNSDCSLAFYYKLPEFRLVPVNPLRLMAAVSEGITGWWPIAVEQGSMKNVYVQH